MVLGAALLLIVLPIYVNQVGVSLASPLTVRAVLAVGPVLIFLLQLVEGRLSPSPYSLACAVLYGVFAVSAAAARRRPIKRVRPIKKGQMLGGEECATEAYAAYVAGSTRRANDADGPFSSA